MKHLKKILVLSAILIGFIAYAVTTPSCTQSPAAKEIGKTDSVWICNSTTAYAYHSSSSCRGLNRCTHGIVKVSASDAVNKMGRVPCKICY